MDSLTIDSLLSDVVEMAPDVAKKWFYESGDGSCYRLNVSGWNVGFEFSVLDIQLNHDILQQAIKEALIRRGLQFEIMWRPARKIWRVDIVPQDEGTAVRAECGSECGSECEALLLAFKTYLEDNRDRISSKPDSLRNSA